MRKSCGLGAAILTAVLTALAGGARAIPLDAPACASLNQEQATLEGSGVLTELRMKPEEAKALPKDKVERLQHYVDVSGQILFRCLPPPEPVAAEPAKPPVKAAAVTTVRRKIVVLRKKH